MKTWNFHFLQGGKRGWSRVGRGCLSWPGFVTTRREPCWIFMNPPSPTLPCSLPPRFQTPLQKHRAPTLYTPSHCCSFGKSYSYHLNFTHILETFIKTSRFCGEPTIKQTRHLLRFMVISFLNNFRGVYFSYQISCGLWPWCDRMLGNRWLHSRVECRQA